MIAINVLALMCVLCLAGGIFLGKKLTERKLNKRWVELYNKQTKTAEQYHVVLDSIRRDRMLFTRHPKFRETANIISRLCS